MGLLNVKRIILSSLVIWLTMQCNIAGPPFLTDDPEPVPFKHWEYYISSIDTYKPTEWSGTSPHFEVNYGLVRNMQVHLLIPVDYNYKPHRGTKFGYADTEIGAKYRFLRETGKRPQVGVFPIIEIPTVKNDEFSDGRVKVFLPVWIQKSWHKLTTYGGAGYTINPGKGNRNPAFLGWELQYDFTRVITFGGELYYQTADATGGQPVTAFNLGGYFNFSEQFHIIYSVGHSLTNENFYTSYFGLLWTI